MINIDDMERYVDRKKTEQFTIVIDTVTIWCTLSMSDEILESRFWFMYIDNTEKYQKKFLKKCTGEENGNYICQKIINVLQNTVDVCSIAFRKKL